MDIPKRVLEVCVAVEKATGHETLGIGFDADMGCWVITDQNSCIAAKLSMERCFFGEPGHYPTARQDVFSGNWRKESKSTDPFPTRNTSLEDLAKEQGVQPIENIDDLVADFWPEEESADDFIAFAMEGRREETVPPEELALLRKKAAAWDRLEELRRETSSYLSLRLGGWRLELVKTHGSQREGRKQP